VKEISSNRSINSLLQITMSKDHKSEFNETTTTQGVPSNEATSATEGEGNAEESPTQPPNNAAWTISRDYSEYYEHTEAEAQAPPPSPPPSSSKIHLGAIFAAFILMGVVLRWEDISDFLRRLIRAKSGKE